MNKYPKTPPPGNMERKQRMDRLHQSLVDMGLYVWPVCNNDEKCTEWGYFIVAVDDHLGGQDQG